VRVDAGCREQRQQRQDDGHGNGVVESPPQPLLAGPRGGLGIGHRPAPQRDEQEDNAAETQRMQRAATTWARWDHADRDQQPQKQRKDAWGVPPFQKGTGGRLGRLGHGPPKVREPVTRHAPTIPATGPIAVRAFRPRWLFCEKQVWTRFRVDGVVIWPGGPPSRPRRGGGRHGANTPPGTARTAAGEAWPPLRETKRGWG